MGSQNGKHEHLKSAVPSAKKKGFQIDKDQAKELIYGMPYEKWKSNFQIERKRDEIEKVMNQNKK